METRTPFDLEKNIHKALADQQLRKNLRSAMDLLVSKRKAVFSDTEQLERLRSAGNAIKRRALSQLPQLLELLEANCQKNGILVHWAQTAEQANQIVLGILRTHDAHQVVKGKSMVSEEMHLNSFLDKNGIEAVETDLGEFIIQLNCETPSHIIVPAIHKNRDDVARIFHDKIPGTPYTENVEELTAIARNTLRKHFAQAGVGLSGVNFAVAETGTLVLVENEGNGRMCTTVPEVHIAVMGIEKVVEKLEDVPPLLRLLTGSATGQIITTYINMISGPRKPDEKDGPKQVHLVLLDNGRTNILEDPELRQILLCIRCGTCLNHCPVYVRIGGHAYGHVYPGPIGKLLTPLMEGSERAGGLPTASTLCGACAEVCPVKIPIPDLLRRLRSENIQTNSVKDYKQQVFGKNQAERWVWRGWALANLLPALNQTGLKAAGLMGERLPKIGPLKEWTSARKSPRVALKTLHERVKTEGVSNE